MFASIQTKLIAALGFLLALLAGLAAAFRAGKKEVKSDINEENLKTVQRAQKIRDMANALDEPAVNDRLRKFKRTK